MKSRAAILIASIPKLAPRVPAPISDGTSISLIFFITNNRKNKHLSGSKLAQEVRKKKCDKESMCQYANFISSSHRRIVTLTHFIHVLLKLEWCFRKPTVLFCLF